MYLGREVRRFLERSRDLSLVHVDNSSSGHCSRLFPAKDRTSSLQRC